MSFNQKKAEALQSGKPGAERAMQRLEDENEQLRVALEDLRENADTLSTERNLLADQLAARERELRGLQSQLAHDHEVVVDALRSKLSPSSARLFDEVADRAERAERNASEEELRVALEEMQVLAEELEDTNTALNLANQELDRRVAERTAALETVNQQLTRSEQRLRLALGFAAAGTWECVAGSDEAMWSEDFAALHGMLPAGAEASRHAWLDSIHQEDRAAVERALLDCLESGMPEFAVEYRVQHPHRGVRWLASRGRLLFSDHGQPGQLVGLTFDVTDRKEAELRLSVDNVALQAQIREAVAEREAAQSRMFQAMKLEALGQLTGGVAHDFNNLLAVVVSGLSLMSRSRSEEDRAQLAKSMEQAARRGAKLTQRLLSFARRQTLKPEVLNLETWLGEMRELLTPSLRADITVQTEVEPGTAAALVDRGELELALLNLCVNARDAMPKAGTLRIAVRNCNLRPGEDPDGLAGQFVELSVTDTGQGMSEETVNRVFEPFFTTKQVGKGTGLGLPQVYGFARQSGGIARVTSVPGQGTTVTLLLPCTTELPAQPPVSGSRLAQKVGPGLRVLVVEDDEDVASMAVRLLRELGHRVQAVGAADQAMVELEKGGTELLFTDVMLAGGADGLDLAMAAARNWPTLPILLTSGYGGAPERVAATNLPLLRKPYTNDELRRAINSVMLRAGHDKRAPQADTAG
jgi:PAS domain S-box-containing protein